jgi:hypothetical protein
MGKGKVTFAPSKIFGIKISNLRKREIYQIIMKFKFILKTFLREHYNTDIENRLQWFKPNFVNRVLGCESLPLRIKS